MYPYVYIKAECG